MRQVLRFLCFMGFIDNVDLTESIQLQFPLTVLNTL